MSTLSRSDEENVQLYSSGVRASIFKADGSGFIYYPSGNVAICKGVIDGRRRFYIYSNDAKSTPLGAVNEFAVGFFMGPNGMRLALSKVGGLLTDEHGYIVREWRYDPGARMPSPAGVEIRLNKSITFEFRDRGDMRIKFLHDGVSRDLEAGVRPKREGSYLDHSIRLPGGKLEPQLRRISLVSRQQSFGDAMKEKRDLLKPRSKNLAGDCKNLVAVLENGFDNLTPKVEPFPDPSWKECAGGATRRELPRIRSTGLEVGPTWGLSNTIYGDYDREDGTPGIHRSISWAGDVKIEKGPEGGDSSGAFASAAKLRKAGKWLRDLDVRRQLFAENPLLKRSKMLQAASGRYTKELSIPGGKPSATDPTGKATPSGEPLRRIPASRLEAFLEKEAGPERLVTVLCVRRGDPMCNKVRISAELANRILLERLGSTDADGGVSWKPAAAGTSASSARYQIVKVDFGEHQRSADLYGVKSVPAFLMFQGRRLVWSGTLGGSAIKAAPPETAAGRARILLVEPVAKDQVATERVLRRFRCNWDLVLTVPQALSRIQMARTNAMAREPAADEGEGYDVLLMSDALGAAEALALEKAFHGVAQREKHESLVVGLGTVKGDASDMSNSARQVVSVGFTESSDGKRAVLSPHLALVVDVAATKPLRPTALEAVFRCLEKRSASSSDKGKGREGYASISTNCGELEGDRRYKGVTPLRLLEKMEAVRASAHAGVGMFAGSASGRGRRRLRPGMEILVTAQETDCRGFTLDSSTLHHLLEA